MKTDRIVLTTGQKYPHRNGTVYQCIGTAVVDGFGVGYLMRSPKGWICTAVNVFQQEGGAIFWDFSVNGHWEDDVA